MNDKRYRLAFTGRLSPGFDPGRLEHELSQGLGPAKGARVAAMLQEGRRIILAKGLTLAQAEGLQHRLLDLGVQVIIKDPAPDRTPQHPGRKTAPPRAPDPARPAHAADGYRDTREVAAPRPRAIASCPSCGAPGSATSGVRCRSCGAYFHRRDADPAAQAAPTPDRAALTGTVTEPTGNQPLDRLRSQGRLALVGLALIPVLGSGVALHTLFVTRDHQVAYETEAWRVGCMVLDDERHLPTTDRGEQLMTQLLDTNKDEKIHPEDLYDIYGPRICVHEYDLRIGNIGNEPVPELTVSLRTGAIADGFVDRDPAAHAEYRIEDLFAADPRSADPVIEWSDDGTMMQVRDFPVGTYLELRLHVWYPHDRQIADWDRLLASIQVSDGSLDHASPRATVLGRILGEIF